MPESGVFAHDQVSSVRKCWASSKSHTGGTTFMATQLFGDPRLGVEECRVIDWLYRSVEQSTVPPTSKNGGSNEKSFSEMRYWSQASQIDYMNWS